MLSKPLIRIVRLLILIPLALSSGFAGYVLNDTLGSNDDGKRIRLVILACIAAVAVLAVRMTSERGLKREQIQLAAMAFSVLSGSCGYCVSIHWSILAGLGGGLAVLAAWVIVERYD